MLLVLPCALGAVNITPSPNQRMWRFSRVFRRDYLVIVKRVKHLPCSTVFQVASSSGDASKSKVWYPWMTLGGEVNLPLLNRIRQGMVAYVKKHPGARTGDVR